MNVQARYSVDRKIYSAKIDSMTPFGAKVTFSDYGNEEEVGASRELFVCATTLVYACPFSNATLHWLAMQVPFQWIKFFPKKSKKRKVCLSAVHQCWI